MKNTFQADIANDALTTIFKNAIDKMPSQALEQASNQLGADLKSLLPITASTTVLQLVMLNYYTSPHMTSELNPFAIAGASVFNKHIELTETKKDVEDFFRTFIEPTRKALIGDPDSETLIASIESVAKAR